MLKEIMDYYNKNLTDCYLLLLDILKSFDRVEYYQLINSLHDIIMCPIVLQLMCILIRKIKLDGMICHPIDIIFLIM